VSKQVGRQDASFENLANGWQPGDHTAQRQVLLIDLFPDFLGRVEFAFRH